MSFSSDVKKELLGQMPRSRHCQLAELAGIINMDGAIDKDTGCLVLESENELVIHKYEVLMKKAFSVDACSPLTQSDTKLRGRSAIHRNLIILKLYVRAAVRQSRYRKY